MSDCCLTHAVDNQWYIWTTPKTHSILEYTVFTAEQLLPFYMKYVIFKLCNISCYTSLHQQNPQSAARGKASSQWVMEITAATWDDRREWSLMQDWSRSCKTSTNCSLDEYHPHSLHSQQRQRDGACVGVLMGASACLVVSERSIQGLCCSCWILV